MVTAYPEPPLIFLTTSTSHAPTGRNARVQARSRDAKRVNPTSTELGSFGYFNVDLTGQKDFSCRHRQKRLKSSETKCSGSQQRRPELIGSVSTQQLPLQTPKPQLQLRHSPLPVQAYFDDALKVAAFHIRRRAAHIVHSDPDRTLDALRCRQWCSVSSTIASLSRSPYLDSAIACVVSKVQQVVSGGTSERDMLLYYSEALGCLRGAVLQSSHHDRVGMLAATQLLAIYEMLDFPSNGSWMQHVAGAAALTKLQELENADSVNSQAAPMFVEALLNDDESFFDSQLWRTLSDSITLRHDGGSETTGEELPCFTGLRSVFSEARSATLPDAKLDWPTRLPLLSRAHELRSRIKSLILQNERRLTEVGKGSKNFDLLGLCLVSVMMLDKLILTLRQGNAHPGTNLEADTQGLCTRMVRLELNASDFHPGEELLLAFQRQVKPSLLSCDT